MRNQCPHRNIKALDSKLDVYFEWCTDCGATRLVKEPLATNKWLSPRLAKEGHSDACRDYD